LLGKLAPAAAALLALAFLLPNFDVLGIEKAEAGEKKKRAEQQKEREKDWDEVLKIIRKHKETRKAEDKNKTISRMMQRLEEDIKRLKQRAIKNPGQREEMRRLSQLENKISKARRRLSMKKGLSESMKKLGQGKKLSNKSLQEAAEALRKGEMNRALQRLNELAKDLRRRLKSRQLTSAERERLSRDLKRLSDMMRKASNKDLDKLAKALKQLSKSLKSMQNDPRLEKLLNDLMQEFADLPSLDDLADMQNMQQMLQNLQSLNQLMQQLQNMRRAKAGPKCPHCGKPSCGNCGGSRCQHTDFTQGKTCNCQNKPLRIVRIPIPCGSCGSRSCSGGSKCGGSMPGSMGGSGDPNKPSPGGMGGPGRGRGGKAPEEKHATTMKAVKISAMLNRAGRAFMVGERYGDGVRGEGVEDYREMWMEAKKGLDEALDKSPVPREYEKMVREYYEETGRKAPPAR